ISETKCRERVKTKVIEMLYSWTLSLPDEAKIHEAYRMLKSQGIVLVDPEIPLDATLIPSPSPRPKNPVFDDEKKSKRLSELLKSKKPEDLQEANRLIKNMVKEELYTDCDKLRQTVFQLATETEDNDSSLGDILQASDDLSHVITSYKKIVEGETINGETAEAQQTVRRGRTNHSEILIDLVDLDVQSASPPQQPPSSSLPADLLCGSAGPDAQSLGPAAPSAAPSAALSLLDEELLSLVNIWISSRLYLASAFSTSLFQLTPVNPAMSFPGPVFSTSSATFPLITTHTAAASPAPSATPVPPPQASTSPTSASLSHNLQDLALLDLGSPKRSSVSRDRLRQNGVRVLLHFATDCPAGRPDVLVIVVSMLNTAPLPVREIFLQVAVPKMMKVRLQSPSGTELAPFNPMLPPAAITQVMLLANPLKEGVKTENNEHINLKVAGQDGSVVQFKIKRHTPLSKLMKAYCERQGLTMRQIRFRFDGQPINETDTPSQV
ncbi:ADP-ribosylation factor-binding protein GGA3, partial [Nibea albiflora]